MRIASWNINGLRAVMRKGELEQFVLAEHPDILLLDEVKIKPEQVDFAIDGYRLIINSADRPGYSGTGALVKNDLALDLGDDRIRRNLPLEIASDFTLADKFGDTNREGRVLTLELSDFYLVGVYTPNSKGDLSRLELRASGWDPAFLAYMNELRQSKPVIFGGDLNVAAQPIDLANPEQNEGKHGYTIQERVGFSNYIDSGFIDSFRRVNGDVAEQYSWWSNWAHSRERNIGWRIDYLMVDSQLMDKITDAKIYQGQMGSDHCPISVDISDG